MTVDVQFNSEERLRALASGDTFYLPGATHLFYLKTDQILGETCSCVCLSDGRVSVIALGLGVVRVDLKVILNG